MTLQSDSGVEDKPSGHWRKRLNGHKETEELDEDMEKNTTFMLSAHMEFDE